MAFRRQGDMTFIDFQEGIEDTFGSGGRTDHVAPVAMRDRDLQDLALLLQTRKRRVDLVDPYPRRPRQKAQPRVAHQAAGK